MGKFFGSIGFIETAETAPGVWSEVVTRKDYYGDVLKLGSRIQSGDGLNDDLRVNHQISIVADLYAYENFHNMRFVEWMGIPWKITNIEERRPRLILSLGGKYNEQI